MLQLPSPQYYSPVYTYLYYEHMMFSMASFTVYYRVTCIQLEAAKIRKVSLPAPVVRDARNASSLQKQVASWISRSGMDAFEHKYRG